MIQTGLEGRVVIVTGAARGIGKATAQKFSREGCKVASWDISEGGAEANGIYQRVDVTNSEAVEQAVRGVIDRWGAVDVLVNNAGVLRDAMLIKSREGETTVLSDEQFESVISVNLSGVFRCTRAVAPHMIAAKRGVILNASSVVALYGNFGQTNYIASKAGVIGMTKVWARELGKHNIRVNAVAPGMIATEMIQGMPEKALQALRERTPLGRMGEAKDVANAYLWLASDAASFITGAVLSVDGGIVPGT